MDNHNFSSKLTFSTRHWTSSLTTCHIRVDEFIKSIIFEMETAAMLVRKTSRIFSSYLVPQTESSCKTFFLTMSSICMKMNLHTKRIFAMVSHKHSLWHRGQKQLGSNLFCGSSTLFLCKHFLLFQEICMDGQFDWIYLA